MGKQFSRKFREKWATFMVLWDREGFLKHIKVQIKKKNWIDLTTLKWKTMTKYYLIAINGSKWKSAIGKCESRFKTIGISIQGW